MIKKKRAVIEIQFNWIFILIAGILILMFFVGIASWYKTNEDQKIALNVLEKLQTIMTGAGVSSSTASELQIPKLTLQFTCNPGQCDNSGCTSGFNFKGLDISKDTETDIIFTQKKLENEFLHIWALEWALPYKVTNFLYITSRGAKVYLVYDDTNQDTKTFAEAVAKKLHENSFLDYELVSVAEAKNKKYNNEYYIRYVFFQDPGSFAPHTTVSKSGKWSKIWLQPNIYSSPGNEFGKVKFYDESSLLNMEYAYIGMPSLIGAIYAEDFKSYQCNMKKALLKLRIVSEIYERRTTTLSTSGELDNYCKDLYLDSINPIQGIKAIANNFKLDTVSTPTQHINQLKNNNNLAQTGVSCPRIY